MSADQRNFVRVYRLPKKLSGGYPFNDGVPITFTNVARIETVPSSLSPQETRDRLIDFVKGRDFFDPAERFLLLGDDPDFTFTIGEIKQ